MAAADRGVVETYRQNGKEFVSVKEFATRTGVKLNTIQKYIKERKLKISKEVGKKRYLEWEREQKKLQNIVMNNALTREGNALISVSKTKADIETKETEEITDIKDLDTGIVDVKQLFKNFDEKDFEDCLAQTPDGEIIKDSKGRTALNWTIVNKKITALIRNLELKRKEGELIRIDEVTTFLTLAYAKTRTKLSNIPERYISRFTAFYKKETGEELSNETATAIKNMLEAESKNILADLQKEIENSEYSENN